MGIFEIFFYTMVSIGKVSFSAKCLFGRIGGLNFFSEKNMDAGFENFHICYAKQRPFFFDFCTPLFSGRRPDFLESLVEKAKTGGTPVPIFFFIFAVAKKGWPAALGTDEGIRPPGI